MYIYVTNTILKSRIMESCPRKLQKSICYHYVLCYSGKKNKYKYDKKRRRNKTVLTWSIIVYIENPKNIHVNYYNY